MVRGLSRCEEKGYRLVKDPDGSSGDVWRVQCTGLAVRGGRFHAQG